MREKIEAAFPPRLRLARQFRGWTQAELGDAVGVTRQFIHQLESAQKPPPELLRPRLASELGFESRFFAAPITIELRDDECHFRKRRTTPVHTRTRVLAHGSLFCEFVAWLDRNLRLPDVAIPHLEPSSAEAIERAAEECRSAWNLTSDAPIDNVSRTLERAGVVVTTFAGISEKVDAFSWHGHARPLVIRSTDKRSPDRSRFDLAHECGHLVLHAGVITEEREREAEADRFASAFLLPRRGFVREFPRTKRLNWTKLIALKERWGASLQAIVRRAHDLGLLDSDQYRRAYIHISKRGWRIDEPGEVVEEPPELVETAVRFATEQLGVASADLANELGWSARTFERVVGLPAVASDSNVVTLASRQGVWRA